MKRLVQAIHRLFAKRTQPTPRMNSVDVLTAARAYMEARGGRLEEPVYLSVSEEGKDKRLLWLVRDNGNQRDGNAYLRIDDATGLVVDYTVPGSAPGSGRS